MYISFEEHETRFTLIGSWIELSSDPTHIEFLLSSQVPNLSTSRNSYILEKIRNIMVIRHPQIAL